MTKRNLCRLTTQACLILSMSWTDATWATVMNGDFSDGLNHWDTEGLNAAFNPTPADVSVNPSEEAVIGDNGSIYSLLYQPVQIATPGNYLLEFDFLNALSSSVPFGTLPDSFFATLYLVDDLADLDILNGLFDVTVELFSLDYNGPYDVHAGATISPSAAKSARWSHFSLMLPISHNYAAPAFELVDQNFIDNDSQVGIDNVSLSMIPFQVPTPGTFVLLLAGLSTLTWRVDRRKRGSTSVVEDFARCRCRSRSRADI